jgi:hypothetical protein
MNRHPGGRKMVALQVERLEDRCLLSGLATLPQPLQGAGLSGPAPAAVASPAGHAALNPREFTTKIDNPYMPLPPGTTFVYTGTSAGQNEVDVVQVTNRTRVIDGVRCRVVVDTLFAGGQLQEKTLDYFAQDGAGNVWYFGEDTAEFQNGKVISTEGTWHAGVNGASPGIIMEANPQVGDTYRQEFAKGVAEDMATVLSLTQTVNGFTHVLQTKEFTPLEPGAVEQKFYAPGVGVVHTMDVSGGNEVLNLVQVIPGD